MRRQWRIGRLILAGLLLGLAVMLILYWPMQPRWSIQGEMALGFDLSRGLLITTSVERPADTHTLHVYGSDLLTGKHSLDLPIQLSNVTDEIFFYWMFLVSEDGSKLAHYGNVIQVFDLNQNGRLLLKCEPSLGVDGLCFSRISSLLAFLSSNEVEIWDIAAGKREAQFTLPQEMISPGGSGSSSVRPERLQFSRDNRLLAISANKQDVIVYDWQAKAEIGICFNARSPMFFADDDTLYTTPVSGEKGGYKRFHIEKEQLIHDSTFTATYSTMLGFQTFNQGHFLTADIKIPDINPPVWIPPAVINYLYRILGLNAVSIKMEVRALATQKLNHQFTLRMNSDLGVPFLLAFSHEEHTTLSPDGQFLVLQAGNELVLWDIPPRRSLWRWIICIFICLLALFLVWPRRVVSQR